MKRKTTNDNPTNDFAGSTPGATAATATENPLASPVVTPRETAATHPEKFRALLNELTALDARPDLDTVSRAEQIKHRQRRAEVARQVYNMQQADTAPAAFDANTQAACRNGEQRAFEARAGLIQKLRAIAGR